MQPVDIVSVRKMLEQLGRKQVAQQMLWEKSLAEHNQKQAWQARWEQEFVRGEVAGVIKMVQAIGQIETAERLGTWYRLFVEALYESKKEMVGV